MKYHSQTKYRKYNTITRFIITITLICATAIVFNGGNEAYAKIKRTSAKIVIDATTGKIIYQHNADKNIYPASLTKMMTLYVLFQNLKDRKLNLKSKIRISKKAASREPSKIGLKPGKNITVENAIKALAIKSANDIAVAVAEKIAKSEFAFAQIMTKQARKIGMTKTTFKNASGLYHAQQKTTARDMATLALRLQRDFPQYYRYFRIRQFTLNGKTYKTHNKLLGKYGGTDGIKTGYIRASGYNLVTSVKRYGKHLIGVVIGEKSGKKRNNLMKTMLEKHFPYATRRRSGQIALKAGNPPKPYSREIKKQNQIPPPPKPKPKIIKTQYQNTQTNNKYESWKIQVGAYRKHNDAIQQINQVRKTGRFIINGKKTETSSAIVKSKPVYRARFVGFSQNDAINACKQLNKKDIQCITIPPANGS